MSNTQEGGPAFPSEDHEAHYWGMSLRDYFAAKAMEGDLAHHSFNVDVNADIIEKRAALYYSIADAMLKVRQK